MAIEFPLKQEEFLDRCVCFFRSAATQQRDTVSIEGLQETFDRTMRFDLKESRTILDAWLHDAMLLADSLYQGAILGHQRHGHIPDFTSDIVVAYVRNTIADRWKITDPPRLEIPIDIWRADSLFKDYELIIRARTTV